MLFGKKKNEESALPRPAASVEPSANKLDTIIGQGASVNGLIATEGSLRIDGRVEGEIKSTGDVIIGEKGVVIASISAQNISVAGSVNGNITANGKLDLLASGKIIGDICIEDLVICQGAILKGEVEMSSPAAGELPDNEKDKKSRTPR